MLTAQKLNNLKMWQKTFHKFGWLNCNTMSPKLFKNKNDFF